MNIKIGIDIDGPVYPWHYLLHKHFVEEKGYTGSIYEFWNGYFQTLSEDEQNSYVLLKTLYSNCLPDVTVKQGLNDLASMGEIYYITARDSSLIPATLKFFDYMEPPFKENLIFERDKATFVRKEGIGFFVDDFSCQVRNMMSITNAYLFAMPHNIHDRDGLEVVNGLMEFKTKIEEKLNGNYFK